jgi:hypothetical protein
MTSTALPGGEYLIALELAAKILQEMQQVKGMEDLGVSAQGGY